MPEPGGNATVAGEFLRFLQRRHYRTTPPASLTDADPSVTFVNANITPFKPRLSAGATVGRTCQVQPCVRANGGYPWLFTFGMIGTVADAAHLSDVCRDVPEALLHAASWLAPADFVIAIDRRDQELVTHLRWFVERGAAYHYLDRGEIETRWSYGRESGLTGRGLTMVRRPPVACGRDCAPRCACGQWRELGNIIVVDGPAGSYLETGFGLESIRATTKTGGLYDLPEIAAPRARLTALGLTDVDSNHVVNLHRVLEVLAAAGARPGNRGPGHVMRRFSTRLLDLVARQRPGTDPADAARVICWSDRVVEVLAAEAERTARSRAGRHAAARAFVRRTGPAGVSADLLRDTFGLDADEARALLP